MKKNFFGKIINIIPKSALATLLILIFVFSVSALGQSSSIPHMMNYQGILTDTDDNPLNGTFKVTFKLYHKKSGGTAFWRETHMDLHVKEGLFEVLLGSNNPLLVEEFSKAPTYLGVTVEDDSEMKPRQRLVSSPYALVSEEVMGGEDKTGYWTEDGFGNIHTTKSGNVGIGIKDPRSKLHVSDGPGGFAFEATIEAKDDNWGGLLVQGEGDGATYSLISLSDKGSGPNDYLNSWLMTHKQDPSHNLWLTYWWEDSTGMNHDTALSVNPAKGLEHAKVGIETTNPREELEVNGDSIIGGNLQVEGNLNVSGIKNFVAPDPANPDKKIYYSAQEGPEAGTYIRGTAKLDNGEAVIDLPDHFQKVTSKGDITVQLTPVGEWLKLYVEEKGLDKVVVKAAEKSTGKFDYRVEGVREGHEDFKVVRSTESENNGQ